MNGPSLPTDELSGEAADRILATVQRAMANEPSAGRARNLRLGAGVLAGVVLAAGLGYAVAQERSSPRVKIAPPASTATVEPTSTLTPTTMLFPTTTVFPAIAPKNFLIVGSDGGDCETTDPAISGNPDEFADTVMVVRVGSSGVPVIVSFPRDLWVKVPRTSGSDRLGSLYSEKDPTRLVAAIEANFGFEVDHYLDVDMCAFRDMVDAVGGVKVPFVFPAFDSHTGFVVPAPNCVTLQGGEALAYFRSFHYQWYDGKRWNDDPSGDLGRIARQQDFVKRLMATALDRAAGNAATMVRFLDEALENVTIDDQLTLNQILELALTLSRSEVEQARTLWIEGTAGSEFRINPDFESPVNKSILAILRGDAVKVESMPQQSASPDAMVPPNDPTCR